MVNLWVGVIMIVWILGDLGLIFLIRGILNVVVLFVFVCVCLMMFLFESLSGIVCVWIGVVFLNFIWLIVFMRLEFKLKFWNVIVKLFKFFLIVVLVMLWFIIYKIVF